MNFYTTNTMKNINAYYDKDLNPDDVNDIDFDLHNLIKKMGKSDYKFLFVGLKKCVEFTEDEQKYMNTIAVCGNAKELKRALHSLFEKHPELVKIFFLTCLEEIKQMKIKDKIEIMHLVKSFIESL